MGFLGFGEKLPQAAKKENVDKLRQEINTLLKQTGYSQEEEINAGDVAITLYKETGDVAKIINGKSLTGALEIARDYLQNVKNNVATAPEYRRHPESIQSSPNKGAWKKYR